MSNIENEKIYQKYISQNTCGYITLWYKLNGKNYRALYYAIKFNPDLKIKIRVFNYYFDEIYISSNTLVNSKLSPNTEKLNNNKLKYLKYKKIIFQNDCFQFRIYHIYLTNTHLVLCSIPDAITLAQAYENNPYIANKKLSKFCSNPLLRIQIINSAIKLSKKIQCID